MVKIYLQLKEVRILVSFRVHTKESMPGYSIIKLLKNKGKKSIKKSVREGSFIRGKLMLSTQKQWRPKYKRM
jgi:hypothetical protein